MSFDTEATGRRPGARDIRLGFYEWTSPTWAAAVTSSDSWTVDSAVAVVVNSRCLQLARVECTWGHDALVGLLMETDSFPAGN